MGSHEAHAPSVVPPLRNAPTLRCRTRRLRRRPRKVSRRTIRLSFCLARAGGVLRHPGGIRGRVPTSRDILSGRASRRALGWCSTNHVRARGAGCRLTHHRPTRENSARARAFRVDPRTVAAPAAALRTPPPPLGDPSEIRTTVGRLCQTPPAAARDHVRPSSLPTVPKVISVSPAVLPDALEIVPRMPRRRNRRSGVHRFDRDPVPARADSARRRNDIGGRAARHRADPFSTRLTSENARLSGGYAVVDRSPPGRVLPAIDAPAMRSEEDEGTAENTVILESLTTERRPPPVAPDKLPVRRLTRDSRFA